MENFKNVLRKRVSLMGAFNALAIVFIALLGVYSSKGAAGSENITGMIHGFQVGIFVGLQYMMVILIFKYQRALKDEDKLKKIYIEENDERTKLIKDKIGGVGFNIAIGAIGMATVMAGFFNQLVFMTLLIVLLFIVFIKAFLKLYYRNKF